MTKKHLPPLEVGQAYVATDFETFEYRGSALLPAGEKAVLRLHLANGTTIDLPAADDELLRLAHVLAAAFPQQVLSVFKKNGWV